MSTEISYAKKQNITAEKLQKYLPKGSGHQVTENVLEIIQNMENDTGLRQEELEEKIMSHMGVFKDMKVDLPDYINAIKYLTLTNSLSNRRAWEIVFPERLKIVEEKLAMRAAEGRAESVNIDSHVSNYNKTDIVVALRTKLAIAPSILYHNEFHEAMMVKVNLMRGIGANPKDRVSPTVQLAAAIAVTDKTQMPIDNNIVLKIGHTDEAKEATKRMTQQLSSVAQAIQDAIARGQSVESVQALNLTHGGIDEDDIEDAELIDEA